MFYSAKLRIVLSVVIISYKSFFYETTTLIKHLELNSYIYVILYSFLLKHKEGHY